MSDGATGPGGAMRDGVVLLHGISRTSRSFRRMQMAIEASGFVTLNLDYASRRKALESLADDIHPAIEFFAAGKGLIHFVGHSMGGLLARAYLARYRPKRLGRVVMLGTPNSGSEIADRLKNVLPYRAWFGPAGQQLITTRDATLDAILPPVDYSVGVIAGDRSIYPISSVFLPKPHDGRVSVENTRLDGMVDHVVIGVSHPSLARSRLAIDQTIAFLRHGRFNGGRIEDVRLAQRSDHP
jgi:pimeloyl-ACP methyl ester carboxylesterase